MCRSPIARSTFHQEETNMPGLATFTPPMRTSSLLLRPLRNRPSFLPSPVVEIETLHLPPSVFSTFSPTVSAPSTVIPPKILPSTLPPPTTDIPELCLPPPHSCDQD